MPAANYVENALAELLKGKSLEESLGAATGVQVKQLYVGFCESNPRHKGVTEVKEGKWEQASAAYKRKAWPNGEVTQANTTAEAEASEPSEISNTNAVSIAIPTAAVVNGVLEYVFWSETQTAETGHIWFYAKLAGKATVAYPTTTEISFNPGTLKLTVL